jgi:hypothetical protein
MRTHLKLGVLLAVVALAALVALTACGGDGGGEGWGWTPPDQETPTPEGREAVTTTPEPERADVPPLKCFSLLDNEEIEEALGERGFSGRGQGWEVCRWQLVADERVFVGMEPGTPGDLEPGAELLGVPGEPVSAVGDEALWFGGTAAEGGGTSGILSVRQGTSLGALHFRIELGHPDLSSAEQLDIAKKLALAALPRFPGVELQEPEPELVTFEREQVDRSNVSFVDNLLAKELAGEWTRGEGLVATLSFFAGEVEAAQVLRQPELVNYSGTGAIRMAREYLEDGPDAQAKTEIARLLERLVPSSERLEAMGGIGPPTAAAPVFHAISLDTAQAADDCEHYWFNTDVCQADVDFPVLDQLFHPGKYRLIFPAETAWTGWTDNLFLLAQEAVENSAMKYEAMGEMPDVLIIFTPMSGSWSFTDPDVDLCTVLFNMPMQLLEDGYFKQWIAYEMANCLIPKTFPAQVSLGYEVIRWWKDGLAIWLSTVVYPAVNSEWGEPGSGWRALPDELAAVELETTLLDRSHTNWLFFEHAQDLFGWEFDPALELIERLPPPPKGGGRAQQEDALAKYDGIERLIHTFAQGLTDENIPDSGGGPVPYEVRAHTVPISGRTVVWEEPQRFGVVRLHLVVDPGKYACLEYEQDGELRSSWRNGAPGRPGGSWSNDLPESLQGEAVFVVTTTEEGAVFTVEVTDVDDDPECEDEEDESEPTPCPIEIGCPPSEYYYKEG